MKSIELSLFDFVDDFIGEQGERDPDQIFAGSVLITFLESLFDQFFAAIGSPITGANRKAKAEASDLAERMRIEGADSTLVRTVIVDFEGFCDLRIDLGGDYSGSSGTKETLYELVQEALGDIVAWAEALPEEQLAKRAREALDGFENAL